MGFSSLNKENYADKPQKHNSKEIHNKAKSANHLGMEPADYSFSESNSTTKKRFSYAVMGIEIQYKLISGISISLNHHIIEATMFPEASRSDTQLPSHLEIAFLGVVFTGFDGLPIRFWKITSCHTFYLSKVLELVGDTICDICSGKIIGSD